MPTYSPKADEIERAWYVVDADGLVLGRLATEVARLLRGKHKPTFAPHIDTGDHVIVSTPTRSCSPPARREKKAATATRAIPGGLKTRTYADAAGPQARGGRAPRDRGCCPRTASAADADKLKVYAGPTHPHAAQKPQPLELDARPRPGVH